jgi:hypothetical protein
MFPLDYAIEVSIFKRNLQPLYIVEKLIASKSTIMESEDWFIYPTPYIDKLHRQMTQVLDSARGKGEARHGT